VVEARVAASFVGRLCAFAVTAIATSSAATPSRGAIENGLITI
jgi:hypothetical protein